MDILYVHCTYLAVRHKSEVVIENDVSEMVALSIGDVCRATCLTLLDTLMNGFVGLSVIFSTCLLLK